MEILSTAITKDLPIHMSCKHHLYAKYKVAFMMEKIIRTYYMDTEGNGWKKTDLPVLKEMGKK